MNPLGQRESAAIPKLNASLIWKKEPRYDSFITAAGGAGVASIPFFSIGKGVPGSGFAIKTEAETNLSAGGKIGGENQFLLYGFTVSVLPNVGAALQFSTLASDTALIYNPAVFRFSLGGNIQLEVPLAKIPTGVGPTGFATNYTAGTPLHESCITNGVPHIAQYYNFTVPGSKLPLLLFGSQTFRCEIVYPLANLVTLAITRIRCYMHGVFGQTK